MVVICLKKGILMNKPILDEESVSAAKQIMKGKFPTMLQYFLEDTDAYLMRMRTGMAEKKTEEIVSTAHTIKSSSLQIGAVRMSDIAQEIEEAARAQVENGCCDREFFAPLVTRLEETFAATKAAFK